MSSHIVLIWANAKRCLGAGPTSKTLAQHQDSVNFLPWLMCFIVDQCDVVQGEQQVWWDDQMTNRL